MAKAKAGASEWQQGARAVSRECDQAWLVSTLADEAAREAEREAERVRTPQAWAAVGLRDTIAAEAYWYACDTTRRATRAEQRAEDAAQASRRAASKAAQASREARKARRAA
jgi:hypothetical protein